MLMRTNDISGLWPMFILFNGNSSSEAILQINLGVQVWCLQLCRVFRWRTSMCFWQKVIYLGSSAPDLYFSGVINRALTFITLRPAAELCLVQWSILTWMRKIKKGHTRLCFLSGMSWKQPFWEHHESFTHLSISDCLGSLQFWHLNE